MVKIKDVKKELCHREWAEQIRACQGSGMKVRDWCVANGLNPNTYYRRLKVVREELLQQSSLAAQPIVPVSLSSFVTENDAANTAPVQIPTAHSDKIIIRQADIEVELPESVSPDILMALLRGLRQC